MHGDLLVLRALGARRRGGYNGRAMQPGDPVLVRSVYRGRVRFATSQRFVGEREGRLALYLAPGTQGRTVHRDARQKYLDRWVGDEPTTEFRWAHTHRLALVRPDAAHSLDLFWDEQWSFLGWYVNLQSPLRRSPLGYDMTDWALDVWVEPDGTWQWKDEGDFAEAQALGILDGAAAASVRAEGERVIAARPWPTGWESWRPPSAWSPLSLPVGWDVVEA